MLATQTVTNAIKYVCMRNMMFLIPSQKLFIALYVFKIIIWNAQGVPQYNNAAHPKHQEEEQEETSLNRNRHENRSV